MSLSLLLARRAGRSTANAMPIWKKAPQTSEGTDPNLGARVGNYYIVSALGAGGMGRVYLARHAYLERYVAIKLLHDHFATDAEALVQFVQEAQAASGIAHPNIVSVLDFGQLPNVTEGGVYLVMEYLEGVQNLGDVLDREGRLPAHRAISIVNQVARALEAVHSCDLVHGDIKPDNVLVTPRNGRRMLQRTVHADDGSVTTVTEPEGLFDFAKLCDFGTSALMKAGSVTGGETFQGTPAYIAPEVARGQSYDHRADLYSLGVLFFELLAGCPPFDGDSPEEIVTKHVMLPPPDPRQLAPDCDCSDAASALVARALAKDPAQRYQSAYELRLDLQKCYTSVRFEEAPAFAEARNSPAAPPPKTHARPALTPGKQHKLGTLVQQIFGK